MTEERGSVAEAATHQVALEAYGVRVLVSTNSAAFFELMQRVFPPGWTPCDPAAVEQRFHIRTTDDGFFDVEVDEDETTASCDLETALGVLETRLRTYVALQAPGSTFVHAGVAASGGRAIVIPGPAFSGKTTLVAALVRAGADYFSDEYAVLDDHGWVSPYARRLSVRSEDYSARTEYHVSEFGGVAATDPLLVGLVVVTHYLPGAEWRPRRLTAGEGVLALLANTVSAQERPEEALRAVSNAVQDAVVLEGERGDAAPLAGRLLDIVTA